MGWWELIDWFAVITEPNEPNLRPLLS